MTAAWETSDWFVFINYLIIAFLLGVLITWYIWRSKVNSLETRVRRNKQEQDNQNLLYRELEDQKNITESNLNSKEQEIEAKDEEIIQLQAELEVVKDQLKKHKSGNVAQSKTIKDFQDQIVELSSKGNKGDEKKIKKLKKEIETLKLELKGKSTAPSSEEIAFEGADEESLLEMASPVAIAIDEAKDDLKKIEGIGPKIEQHLNADGIFTYLKLAGTSVAHLQTLMDKAGSHYSMHDPSSWPEQASLASKGEWHSLKSLQDELTGGRKK